MVIAEIMLISIGLGMDAFAVAVCKGLSMKKIDWKKATIISTYFGVFQGIMPVIGYILGKGFKSTIASIDHWIAFFLLGLIGIKMLREAFDKETEKYDDNVGFKTMIVLAIATSIDALAVGITFAFLDVNIIHSALAIGTITFILSLIGVKIGNIFGEKYGKKAEIFGGTILIIIGLKILLEHTNIIKF